ncbi:hypothetical protein C8C78_10741 [Halanaerobium congolense]|uniref:Uncharacterized protein n=1 Tax=Halanaerobium congolense TaxID=54121 RepID=A0A318EGQ0_9FIRM|nr:hypothetical protein [Halanaerobium congolense]PXV67606.1 hypothetical protein C8C78_10741 [Halanaerobium congolense]
MNKFIKKASIYILVMLFAAAVIFTANYYYGQKIAEDVEIEIRKTAAANDYQLRSLEVESNPLLQKIDIRDASITKRDQFNLIVNQAEISFNWQQIINYIRNQNFEFNKNLETKIAQINYSNLNKNYQINIKGAELHYQGNLTEENILAIKNENDLQLLLEDNHNLDFTAAELKYNFPYYRSYGLSEQDWNRLSTFSDFKLRVDYDQANQNLKLEEFNLSSELLKIIYNFDSIIDYNEQEQQIYVEEAKGNYDFHLTASDLNFSANAFYQDLEFNQFDFNGSFDLTNQNNRIKVNQLDFNLNLNELKLVLAEIMAQQLNENSFGILAENNQFEILINKFSYQQQYSHPNGSSHSELDSSILLAELDTEYNYSEEIPYISSGELRYKPQTAKAEQLNSFLQLVLSERITRNEDGFYQLKFWGPIDSLNLE